VSVQCTFVIDSMKALVGVLFYQSTQGVASKWFLKSARNRGQHFSSASAGFDGILKLMSYSQVEKQRNINYRMYKIKKCFRYSWRGRGII
jgi:hypothetical protein